MFRLFAVVSLIVGASLLTTSALAATGGGGGGGGCREPLRDEHATEVTIEMSCYTPTVIRVQSGGSVTWTNKDDVAHNVLSAGGAWRVSGDSSLLRGASFRHTFEEPGVFPYYCSFHPGMVGAVAVGDFEVSEPMPYQTLMLDADAATAGDGGDGGVPVMALAGVSAGVALAMVGNRIIRSLR
jgi:plastocyanin